MNISTSTTGGTTTNSTSSGSNNSDDNVNFWGNLFDAFGDFGNWLESIFDKLTAGDVSAEQVLKAMKEQQRLLIFVMAMSMAAVMFTVYMQNE